MITNKMMSDSLRIAKSLAPIDSGNLRHNAIKLLHRKNGFTIKYSGVDAYYIQFVEEGTNGKRKQKGQHFILNTYLNLVNYFANIDDNKHSDNYNRNLIAKNTLDMEVYRENPDYRRLVHMQSIYQHYANEGLTNKDGTQQLYRRRGE